MTLEEFIQKKREEYDTIKARNTFFNDKEAEEQAKLIQEVFETRYKKPVWNFIEQAIREAWNQEFKQMVDRAAANSAELQKQLLDNSDLVEEIV